jgi:hypothetical protein
MAILEGTGGHLVRNITSTMVDNNIIVTSDNNRLINVMAESGFNPAFTIGGHNTELIDSIANCGTLLSRSACIIVGGDGNRLVDNFVTSSDSSSPGLRISGNNNVVRRNRAIRNGGIFGGLGAGGIIVTGTGNDLRHNTALANDPVDLTDANGNCVQNTWRSNTFLTRDPECIQ